MTEEKKSEPMFGIYESELCRAIHGIDDAMECHNLKKKICARGTIEQAPATNENHFVINDTLITAIGEWDKGPHNIVKILELLRACPLAEHDAAIAAQERERVLREIFEWLSDPDGGDVAFLPMGLFSAPQPFNAIGLIKKLVSLHPNRKQEREPE